MNPTLASILIWAVAAGPAAQDPRPKADDLPPLEGPVEMLRGDLPAAAPEATLHEALRARGRPEATVRAGSEPPAPVPERAGGGRPSPDARWFGGYWAWDEGRREFGWVSGVWRVPPPGQTWADGRWARDVRGWYRVPGSWGPGRNWRTDGPPAGHPEETIPPAPGPDSFLVPGHHAPDGDDVAWKPARWIKARPGQEWLPAGWVRRSSGWTFREGRWVDASQTTGAADVGRSAADVPALEPLGPDPILADEPRSPTSVRRHLVARPAATEPSAAGGTVADPSPAPGAPPGPAPDGTTAPPPPAGPAVAGAPGVTPSRPVPGTPAGAPPVPTPPPGAAGPAPRYPAYPPGYNPATGAPYPAGPPRPGDDPNRRPDAKDARRQGGPRNPLLRAILRPRRR